MKITVSSTDSRIAKLQKRWEDKNDQVEGKEDWSEDNYIKLHNILDDMKLIRFQIAKIRSEAKKKDK
jgi:hypothetical protein